MAAFSEGGIINPNSNGLGRICPRPVWGLITLKKLKCEKFKKISIPPSGYCLLPTSNFFFKKASLPLYF